MKKHCMVFILGFLLLLLAGCADNIAAQGSSFTVPPASEWGLLESFTYQYGSYHSGEWKYTIIKEEDGFYLQGQGANGVDLTVYKKMSQKEIDALTALVIQQELT